MCDSRFRVVSGSNEFWVPCGRCPPCRQRRINSWVFRMMEEDKVSSSSYFVTLTYDTNNVPMSDHGYMTLCKKDFQDFMKRLRWNTCVRGIKYFACGEYGSTNYRPHYHAILFNVPDPDAIVTAWGKGDVHVGLVSSDSIAYTLKYMDKPPAKGRIFYRDDRVREFPLMSKGLGKSYLTDAMVKYHRADFDRLYCTKPGGFKIALPRYYKERIFSSDEMVELVPDIITKVNARRVLAERDFERLGYDNYTFDQHVQDSKDGRLLSYYKNIALNKRNL